MFRIITIVLLVFSGFCPAEVLTVDCPDLKWQEITPSSLWLRSDAMASYDSDRQVVVLFGGNNGDSTDFLGDTFEWNGTSWLQRAVQGPSPRTRAAMAYDASRRRTVLVGGADANLSYGIYLWDGQKWTIDDPYPPPPPPGRNGLLPRVDASMVYDPIRGELVLFGGATLDATYGDTWICRQGVWEKREVAGPSPRSRHAMAFDPSSGRTVLFGGANPTNLGDTWEWDGTSWTQIPVTGPSPRSRHVMTFDPLTQSVLLYGGPSGNYETWSYRGGVWTKLNQDPTLIRNGGAMVADVARGQTLMMGGAYRDNRRSGETLAWNGESWEFAYAARPYEAEGVAAAADPQRKEVLLFGGSGGSPFLGETWTFDGANWHRHVTPIGPSPRTRAVMAYDSIRKTILLFGGRGSAGLATDTWEWDGVGWSLRAISGPPGREWAAMAFDPVHRQTVLYGGRNGALTLEDTWIWDGQSWQSTGAVGPVGAGTAVYSPVRQELILVASSAAGKTTVWGWNGASWQAREMEPIWLARTSYSGLFSLWDPGRAMAIVNATHYRHTECWGLQTWREIRISGSILVPPVWAAFDYANGRIIRGDSSGRLWTLARPDADCDRVNDPVDNCPYAWNPAQTDTDGDGFGDDCDIPEITRWWSGRSWSTSNAEPVILLKNLGEPTTTTPRRVEPRSGYQCVGIDFLALPNWFTRRFPCRIQFRDSTTGEVFDCTPTTNGAAQFACYPSNANGPLTGDRCGELELVCSDVLHPPSDTKCPLVMLEGDVDGDGEVNMGDLLRIRKLLGRTDYYYYPANVDSVGDITTKDLVVAKAAVGHVASCPAAE